MGDRLIGENLRKREATMLMRWWNNNTKKRVRIVPTRFKVPYSTVKRYNVISDGK